MARSEAQRPKAKHKGPEARHKGPKRETLAQSEAQRLEMEKPKGEQEKNPVKQLATASLSVTENQIPDPNEVESLASATI